MKMLKRILKIFRRRRVLVHTSTGDMICKAERGDIIRVPWIVSTCPFHLEPDGSVTLRLMWDDIPASGYGKVWEEITWSEYTD